MNKGQIWSSELIEQVKQLINQGKNTYEISKIIGLTRRQITNKLCKIGISIDTKLSHTHLYEKYNCLECNKKFTDLKSHIRKFCSHRCAAIFLNKKKSIIKKCLTCTKEFTGKHKQCCSKKCAGEYIINQNMLKIENGDTSLNYRQYKTYLIKKHGEKCMKCGWNEKNPYSGKIPIELEHKDGNSENNSLDNLELLCPNCHSLTKTYKALNLGNGRHTRRERYKDGLSY